MHPLALFSLFSLTALSPWMYSSVPVCCGNPRRASRNTTLVKVSSSFVAEVYLNSTSAFSLSLPPLLRSDVIWYSERMWPTDPKMHYPMSPSPPFHFQVYISISPPSLPSWGWTNPLSQPVLFQAAASRSSIPTSVQNLDVLQSAIKERILWSWYVICVSI